MEKFTPSGAENFTYTQGADQDVSADSSQKEILSALEGQEFQEILVDADSVEDLDLSENNYTFFKLIEPILRDKKILDLFCGSNSLKKFAGEKGLQADVVGVDSHPENDTCDVKADVVDLPTVITPSGQFDIITSFGGTYVENFKNDFKYLKTDGFLILGASDEMDFYNPETQGNILEFFTPLTQVVVKGIKMTFKVEGQIEPVVIDATMKYLILKKKESQEAE